MVRYLSLLTVLLVALTVVMMRPGIPLAQCVGVPICTAASDQSDPQLVSDGARGAIITWEDYRSGNWDIYAQRVDSSDTVLWTTDGVAICTTAGDQFDPQLVSDGARGAIIVWGGGDIYAQRVDSLGAVQWTINGVAICTTAGDQSDPQLVSDGAGGAIITWEDYRSGNWDIYAQRVNSLGAVQWTINGVAICTTAGDQSDPQLVSDGAGGAIITWEDYRSGNWDIYAQRVNSLGAVQWTTDGVAICTTAGDQSDPQLVCDGARGAIIVWGGEDIYAQRVDSLGAVQWTTDGVAICTAAGDQERPQITSDDTGGAIITWRDSRLGSHGIYAQRVDSSETVRWTTNGVAICAVAPAVGWGFSYPQLISDGAGGAIIPWSNSRSQTDNDYNIYAQRVNSLGTVQWTTCGVAICTAAGNQFDPQLVSDGARGAIIVWGGGDIYAQRVDSLGAVQWTTDGVAICTAAGDQERPQITSDDTGGAIITWQDKRSGNWDIYAQRVKHEGEPTRVLLTSFAAKAGDGHVEANWTTASEIDNAGFNLHRGLSKSGPNAQLNEELIPAQGDELQGATYSFTDYDVTNGVTYYYWLEDVDLRGNSTFHGPVSATPTSVEDRDEAPIPTVFSLAQNYPNPFNATTLIRYALPAVSGQQSAVSLKIYNIAGQEVRTLVDEEQAPGYYSVAWDGRDGLGTEVSSGIYFYRLQAGGYTEIKKMVLLK